MADGEWLMADGEWLMANGPSSICHQPSAISHDGLLPTSAAAAPAARAGAAAGEIGGHSRAGLEPQLAFGDDRLAGFEPLLHDDVVGDALPRRNRALLDGGIRLHDEHVLAVLAGLHR